MNRVIILSGPSCVGKGPLHHALMRFHPEVTAHWQKIVCYNSRAPRPGEEEGVDYHFRTRDTIEQLRERDNMVVAEIRNDLQAVDFDEIRGLLQKGDAFFEGNPFVARMILDFCRENQIETVGVFLAPLSLEEIRELQGAGEHIDLPAFIADVMRRKILRRTQKQKGILAAPDLEDIEVRAASAYRELTMAHLFDYVIANHDGEDSEYWEAFYFPLGDARKVLHTFVALLTGQPHDARPWPKELLP